LIDRMSHRHHGGGAIVATFYDSGCVIGVDDDAVGRAYQTAFENSIPNPKDCVG
jgi:hypothetical protein